jgi:RNA polymerase sigma-70 factor (ECF subfamily)
VNEGQKGSMAPMSGEGPDDEQLVAILATGEMYPLAKLYVRYGAMVKEAIRRFAPEISIAEAEEVGQDVFLALAQSAGRYRKNGKFKSWLFGIAVNKARRWRRFTWARRRLLERYSKDPVGIFAVKGSTPTIDAETRDELRHALKMLPTAQREVLVLHAVDGFTGEEIAQILGIKPKTVWTRLHRARKTMLALFKKEEVAAILCREGS